MLFCDVRVRCPQVAHLDIRHQVIFFPRLGQHLRRSNSQPWLFCCSIALITLSRIILVTSTTHTKVRLETNINTEVDTRLHQRHRWAISSVMRTRPHAVCRSSISNVNFQGVNYSHPSRCLDFTGKFGMAIRP
jgi:hypothetical protein